MTSTGRPWLLFISGFLIALVPEFLKVYFIMPFPGSQQSNTVEFAYFLHKNIWFFRLAGLVLVAFSIPKIFKTKTWKRVIAILLIGLYGFVFYMTNFVMLAEKMFYQPRHKIFSDVKHNTVNDSMLVIGVELNGEQKAFPVEFIGYHHQVHDTIGDEPVIVTYCTVCRTGRAFSAFVDDRHERFRLVGMDHFNAMFEDSETKSWWRQENGEAVAGKKKGSRLTEIHVQQMTLKSWIRNYPETQIMQPDPDFADKYKQLEKFDEGTSKSKLTGTSRTSWDKKSWVIGVIAGDESIAYDWNDLLKKRMIEDGTGGKKILLVLESDDQSFHSWDREIDGKEFHFSFDGKKEFLVDKETRSKWNMKGECFEGAMQGKRMGRIKSYQEFWHSWKEFNPGTKTYLQ